MAPRGRRNTAVLRENDPGSVNRQCPCIFHVDVRMEFLMRRICVLYDFIVSLRMILNEVIHA